MARLSKEENEILQAFEKGNLKSAKSSKKDLENYQLYAEAAFKKDKRINIRISAKDLDAL